MYKNLFLLIILTFFTYELNPSGFTLKSRVEPDGIFLFFKDVVFENIDSTIGNIPVYDTKDGLPIKLTSAMIMEKLFNSGINNVTLKGNYVIAESKPLSEYSIKEKRENLFSTPIDLLENHIYSFIDKDKFKVKITVLETIPEIDINLFHDNAAWEIPLIKDGLKDINRFRRLRLKVNNRLFTVRMDIGVFADIYISKGNQKKDDLLSVDNFIKKNTDITAISGFENIVFDIGSNFYLTGNLSNGEILRAGRIARHFDIKRGDVVTVLIERNGISLSVQARALEDGNFNSHLSVRVVNGGNLYGILRNGENGKVVEVN